MRPKMASTMGQVSRDDPRYTNIFEACTANNNFDDFALLLCTLDGSGNAVSKTALEGTKRLRRAPPLNPRPTKRRPQQAPKRRAREAAETIQDAPSAARKPPTWP